VGLRIAAVALVFSIACTPTVPHAPADDAGPRLDIGVPDASRHDAARLDAAVDARGTDVGAIDAPSLDAPRVDAQRSDSGVVPTSSFTANDFLVLGSVRGHSSSRSGEMEALAYYDLALVGFAAEVIDAQIRPSDGALVYFAEETPRTLRTFVSDPYTTDVGGVVYPDAPTTNDHAIALPGGCSDLRAVVIRPDTSEVLVVCGSTCVPNAGYPACRSFDATGAEIVVPDGHRILAAGNGGALLLATSDPSHPYAVRSAAGTVAMATYTEPSRSLFEGYAYRAAPTGFLIAFRAETGAQSLWSVALDGVTTHVGDYAARVDTRDLSTIPRCAIDATSRGLVCPGTSSALPGEDYLVEYALGGGAPTILQTYTRPAFLPGNLRRVITGP